jgi:hypothetical protein
MASAEDDTVRNLSVTKREPGWAGAPLQVAPAGLEWKSRTQEKAQGLTSVNQDSPDPPPALGYDSLPG